MLNVTESAKQHLKKLLLARTNAPEIGLRLSLKQPGKLGIVPGREAEGDQVVEHEGSKVLLVGKEVAQRFAGATLDTEDTPEGTGLVISRK